jgi:uncharacterized protein (TIGR02679 family)
VTDPGVTDPERLTRLLGGDELAWLVDRIRIRLERGEPVDGTVTLIGATQAQRRAAARLLGHSVGRGTSLSVPLPEVAAALRRSGAALGLRPAVEALAGPVRNRAAEQAVEIQRFHEALGAARRSRLAEAAWYQAWLEEISRDGSLTRLLRRGQGQLLGQATAVLEQLCAGGEEPAVLLAVVAEKVTGDARALGGTALAGLVLRALALREGVPTPASRESERALWAAAGVVTDDLASQVLVLNVRAVGEPLGRWLTEAAASGEPFRVTLHQLAAAPIMPLSIDLHVCQNSAVLRSAAGQLGSSSAPLICTEGEPSVACFRLLQAATATGTRIHWHTDFDWPGLRATATAIRRLGAMPWRMGAEDYLAALAVGATDPLKGQAAPSPWDPRLAEVMQSSGRAAGEERMLTALLDDLAAPPGMC